MYSFLQDVRLGIRNLIAKPGFTLVATVTLALGIGANTAIFSVVNGLMFRELPVPQASQLVSITARSPASSFSRSLSFPDYLDYRSMSEVFQDAIAFVPDFAQLTAEGSAERVMAAYTSANYFAALRLDPFQGSYYGAGASEFDGGNQVVLSYSYWQSRFGGQPGVLGQKITFNGIPVTISGVTPPEFPGTIGFISTDLYAPIRIWAQTNPGIRDDLDDRSGFRWRVVARLREDVSVAQAAQAVSLRSDALAREYPDTNANLKALVYPEPLTRLEPSAAEYLPMVARIFLGMVSLVLLIACANVASLLLVRATGRKKEMAIRTALGAARWRIIRQLLVDSLLISALGGLCGLVLASIATRFLQSIQVATDVPLVFDFSLDYRVLIFTLIATGATGILAGLVPAWRTARKDLSFSLREGGRGSGSAARQGLRSALVTCQVAVSLVLLICTGLFLRSMANVANLDPGFAYENRAMLGMDAGLLNYDQPRATAFFENLIRDVRALPGVISASRARSVPLGFSSGASNVYKEGEGAGQTKEEASRTILCNTVDPTYLKTMGFRLLKGRFFEERDDQDSTPVTVVNERMAEVLWPNEDPVGKRFHIDRPDGTAVEVVGMVNTAFYSFPGEPSQPFFYLPMAQRPRRSEFLVVHTAGNPESILPVLRERVAALEPNMPVFEVRTLRSQVVHGKAVVLFRLPAILVGVFALIGAIMASTGLYGLISFSVSQRTHEIGVRVALGASRGSIIRLVSSQGMLLAVLGITTGVLLALLVTRLFANILVGVGAYDPLTYGAVAVLLLTVAAVACFLPARLRTGRVDPVDALRAH